MKTTTKFSILILSLMIFTQPTYATESSGQVHLNAASSNSYSRAIKSFRHGRVYKTRITVLKN